MKKAAIACLTMVVVVSCMSGRALAVRSPAFGYPLAGGTFAQAVTTGPDGSLWFSGVNNFSNSLVIGKVTPKGDVTEYPSPVSFGYDLPAASIVRGPDSNLWFVERAANAIGRSTTDGEITSFPLPESESGPAAIAAGPDGNLWFTEEAADKIGRITPFGQITEFPLPPDHHPRSIVTGPDGSLWFTEPNWIGQITTSGQTTQFQVPGPLSRLNSIAAGPDGNLWFTGEAAARVGRITPQGQITQFPVPTWSGTDLIVSGPDGKLWFTAGFEIGAISTSGVISWPACLVRFCLTPPEALAVGPDGRLWVGAGIEHCHPRICGGGAEQLFLVQPGGVGRYVLPPLTLAIGPHAAPVRHGRTSLLLACGLRAGCRGLLRLGYFEHGGPGRGFRVLSKSHYRLAQGETKRIRLALLLRGLRYRSEYVLALAGPEGQTQAKRSIRLELGPHRQK